jgi:hypothetical protein
MSTLNGAVDTFIISTELGECYSESVGAIGRVLFPPQIPCSHGLFQEAAKDVGSSVSILIALVASSSFFCFASSVAEGAEGDCNDVRVRERDSPIQSATF